MGQHAQAEIVATGAAVQAGKTPTRWHKALLIGLLLVGAAARILPLLQGTAILMRRPTEDGYLMLTVARNMAIGLGMSTAAGTIPTNGVQPLATGLFALCFWLTGGDKESGVALVMWVSFCIAALAALALYQLGLVLLRGRPDARPLAGLIAALWFASPVVLGHSMNALETGLCFLTTALVFTYFFRHAPDVDTDLPVRRALALGALLGLAFWARNDNVFLAVALVVARLAPAVVRSWPLLVRRVGELTLVGLTTIVLASPWMISNQLRFGSVVPISGGAQSIETPFASNLAEVPSKLVEMITVVGAIPQALETRPPVLVASLLLILVTVGAAVLMFRRSGAAVRTALLAGGVHTALLTLYYGLFFGAPHFLSRYLSPASLLMAIFVVVLVAHLLRSLPRLLAPATLLAAVLVAVGLDARLYAQRHDHMHFQVVDWVRAHVPEQTWVGAVQTGTLGFFHDRTINLDGKTNPQALAARKATRMRNYIVDSPIEYIVDWSGLAVWQGWLSPQFQLQLQDKEQNLSVFKRARRS